MRNVQTFSHYSASAQSPQKPEVINGYFSHVRLINTNRLVNVGRTWNQRPCRV